jgi:hypothetical protein
VFNVPITLDDVSAVCLSLLYDGLIEYHHMSRTTVRFGSLFRFSASMLLSWHCPAEFRVCRTTVTVGSLLAASALDR